MYSVHYTFLYIFKIAFNRIIKLEVLEDSRDYNSCNTVLRKTQQL